MMDWSLRLGISSTDTFAPGAPPVTCWVSSEASKKPSLAGSA